MNAVNECRQIAAWLEAGGKTIVFTGAGISTESGIPDFRSPGGVWATNRPIYFQEYQANASARYEYWQQKVQQFNEFSSAQPNSGHHTLAAWEERGLVSALVTQNIDGLHQISGSRRVLELHGTARQIGCLECLARYETGEMHARFLANDAVPKCPDCGGMLKHAVVSFGQSLPVDVLQESLQLAKQADLFLVLGSSLVVEPAASLPRYARQYGAKLAIINRDPTPLDDQADCVIHDSIGSTLEAIDRLVA
jgi:NAD-dependent deacetylase